jgi:plastocyanin
LDFAVLGDAKKRLVGEHRYDCSLHPNDMSGTVIVTEP